MNIHENNINLCDPNFVGNGCGPLAIQKFLKNLLKLEIFGSITPLEKRTVRICKVRPSILFVSTIFGGRQRIRRLAPVLAKALLLRHLPRRPAGDLSAPKKGVCIADAFFGERLCAARGFPADQPNSRATRASSSRMAICCGQTCSHFPHWMHSPARSNSRRVAAPVSAEPQRKGTVDRPFPLFRLRRWRPPYTTSAAGMALMLSRSSIPSMW